MPGPHWLVPALVAATVLSAEERSVAVGLLLDAPCPPAVLERSIEIAEGLRRAYGIDTGRALADREAAARQAQREWLDDFEPSDEEIAVTAAELGYSLDPVHCADACDNVRALATLELKKRALVRFALSP